MMPSHGRVAMLYTSTPWTRQYKNSVVTRYLDHIQFHRESKMITVSGIHDYRATESVESLRELLNDDRHAPFPTQHTTHNTYKHTHTHTHTHTHALLLGLS